MMLFKYFIISIASLATASHAAVNFYGSKGHAGDHVTCASKNHTDTQLADLFSLIYPGEAVQNSTSFQFDSVLVCGDDASRSVVFNCNDIGAKSMCVEDRRKVTAKGVRRTLPTKRDSGFKCDKYSGQCRNEYQSQSGWCSSGYTTEQFDVKGYAQDIWCSKPCTEEEKQSCQNVKCTTSRDSCERKDPLLENCVDALVKCEGAPIKMKESWCNTKYISGGLLRSYCRSKRLECVHYEDGACSLDMSAWNAQKKNFLGHFGAGPGKLPGFS